MHIKFEYLFRQYIIYVHSFKVLTIKSQQTDLFLTAKKPKAQVIHRSMASKTDIIKNVRYECIMFVKHMTTFNLILFKYSKVSTAYVVYNYFNSY